MTHSHLPDISETTDTTLTGATFALVGSTATSDEYAVLGRPGFDVYLNITADGSVTLATVYAESTGVQSPASTDWAPMMSDDAISAGAVTASKYLVSHTIIAAPPTATYHWYFPASGAHMRFRVYADSATGTYTLKAMRQ